MTRPTSRRRRGGSGGKPAPAGAEEVRRILGDLDDEEVVKVLETNPSMEDLQQAAAALNGDLAGHIGRPIEGAAARIYDMLVEEDAEDPRSGPRDGSAAP